MTIQQGMETVFILYCKLQKEKKETIKTICDKVLHKNETL